MQVTRAPAHLGWSWVSTGFRMLSRRPLALTGLSMLMLFTLFLASILPIIGGILPMILSPLLSVGYMHAVRMSESGQAPTPWMLYEALRRNRAASLRPLILLGIIQSTLTLVALLLTGLLDDGALFKAATGSMAADDPAINPSKLLVAGGTFALLYTPVQMALWFAPIFVAWHGLPPLRSMFYSLVAVWRNKGAFTVYALGWLIVCFALSVALTIAGMLLPVSLLGLLVTLAFLALFTAGFCSFWPVYRDLIQDDSPPEAGNEPPQMI